MWEWVHKLLSNIFKKYTGVDNNYCRFLYPLLVSDISLLKLNTFEVSKHFNKTDKIWKYHYMITLFHSIINSDSNKKL